MDIGLGLPVSDPTTLIPWARRAERGPFRTVALLDRLAFGNPEPLVALAAIVGATERIRVQTEVLIAPLHRTSLLAKQASTLQSLSGGRFTLGIGLGGFDDDYVVAGVDRRTRGARLDDQLARLHRLWAEATVGPATPRPEILFGGFAPPVIERVARWGDGFLGAGLPPEHMAGMFGRVRDAWGRAGRTGEPRLVAQVNVAVGPPRVVADAESALRAYYGANPYLGHILDGLVTTPAAVRDAVASHGDIGADEVVFYCWAADPEQVDRIADALA